MPFQINININIITIIIIIIIITTITVSNVTLLRLQELKTFHILFRPTYMAPMLSCLHV
jgi:hypothetical protein